MALLQDASVALTGIPIHLTPGNVAAGWEIQRSPNGSTGWVTVAQLGPLGPSGATWVDWQPLGSGPWWYQVRQTRPGWQPSSYVPANPPSASPVQLDASTLYAVINRPASVVGVLVDALAPSTKYAERWDANAYADPDSVDGIQSYLDWVAATNFLRLGAPPKAIAGSTNANPSVVNVVAHGYTSGDVVTIRGHLTNTAINGTWVVTVTDADHFSVPVAGVGTGGTTGHVVKLRLTVDPSGNLNLYGGLLTAGQVQDRNGKFLLNLDGALATVVDAQGSPVTRVKLGKVGAGTADYGIQVWDQNGAVVIDFTGAKRILAVPVQPSVDSGTSLTVDLSTGLTQQIRLTGTATITLNNPVDGGRYRIWFQQDPTGSRPFPTFTNAVMFTNDTAPTLTTTPGAMDLFEFEYRASPSKRFTCMTLQTNILLPTPSVTTVQLSQTSVANVSHSVTMPTTTVSGELLLIAIFFSSAQGAVTTPTGWTLEQTTGQMSVFARVADGTEGGTSVTVTTANSVKSAQEAYRITRWFGALGGILVSVVVGAPGTSATPPALTPSWATDRTLWLIGVGTTGTPTLTDPAVYGNGQTETDGASTGQIRTMRLTAYAATETPGAFTWTGSQTWSALAIAVQPPA